MDEPDPWADLADDIRRAVARHHHPEPAAGCRCASCLERRGYAEQAEAWQARATQAEARVAELEAAVAALVTALEWALGQTDGRGGMAHPTSLYAGAEAAARAALAKARAMGATPRVAELEAEAKALADDRGRLMGVLAAQTGETMRLRGACEAAAAMLREDRPKAALAMIEEAARA